MKKGQYKHNKESIKKAVETRRKNGSYNTSWNKGIPMRKSTKKKQREIAIKENRTPPSRKGKISPTTRLENHSNWKGDNANYFALHQRVRKYFQKSKKCEWCGTNEKKLYWANISGEYKFVIEDWITLCGSCHYKQEKTVKNKKFKSGKLNPDYTTYQGNILLPTSILPPELLVESSQI